MEDGIINIIKLILEQNFITKQNQKNNFEFISLCKFIIKENIKKNIKILFIIDIFILIILFHSDFSIFTNEIKYKGLLPRTSLNNKTVPTLEEIFNSRELYINNEILTGNYIRYIRPINETEEKRYAIFHKKNLTIKNIDELINREGKYDYQEFVKFCLKEQLIDKTVFKFNKKPLISVVAPSYNKGDFLIKSIRSIQNQNLKNIEIIIVNDCSTDNSNYVFKYLMKTDPRIRIIHHLKNMGCWRSRIDGILYSRAKYIILFDVSDLYADNYILNDAYKIINKYHLDSVKFFFRLIYSYNNINETRYHFQVPDNSTIIYQPKNIIDYNTHIFSFWGNIWNRLTRANIFIKGLYLLNDKVLSLYKNVWDDIWFNEIINRASYSFYVFDRVGYIYLQNGKGAGSPASQTEAQKDHKIREWLSFLYFDYNFLPQKDNKLKIIEKLRKYNKKDSDIQLSFIKSKFYVLNDLLNLLIDDPYVNEEDKNYLKSLLTESKNREKNITKIY